jgi:phytoene dehydrogenase-like protein
LVGLIRKRQSILPASRGAGYADYRGPITGLYLCGSGGHPGGGVSGAPGHNAAREILRDFKRKRIARARSRLHDERLGQERAL